MMKKLILLLLILISMDANIVLIWLLNQDVYNSWLIFLWIFSQVIFMAGFLIIKNNNANLFSKLKLIVFKKTLFVAFICFFPVITRLLVIYFLNASHIHRDEFISGYISTQVDFIRTNFFNPQPTDIGLWVAQFPSLYFYIQGLFFKIFGVQFWQLKLSNIGYFIAISLLTYRLTFKIYKNHIAPVSIILIFSTLAPALYFDTLTTHFIASTCVYMIFLNVLEGFLRSPSPGKSGLLGIVTGFNYLFYISSYIALPMAFLGMVSLFFKIKFKSALAIFGLFIFGLVIVLSPFTVNMFKENFYLGQRFKDLNLLTNKSEYNENPSLKKEVAFSTLKKSFSQTGLSFVKDGVGGAESYAFGKQKFLEPFSLSLFIIGFFAFIFIGIKKRNLFLIIFILSVTAPILSVAISTPPPGIHRLSLTFPLIAILIGFLINKLLNLPKLWKSTGVVMLIMILVLNLIHFQKAIIAESKDPALEQRDIKIIKNIFRLQKENRKLNTVYMAAYPGFAFDKIFSFFLPDVEIITDYHDNLSSSFDPNKTPYLYVVLWPQDYLKNFTKQDPKGTGKVIIQNEYGLFYRFN